MRRANGSRRGVAMIEFIFVGIPTIFVLVSSFEMARGMWIYHTMAYAVKEGARYASVHGSTCSQGTNSCGVAIKDIAGLIRTRGIGLDAAKLTLTFTDDAGNATTCLVSAPTGSCLSNNTTWPPAGENDPGLNLTVSGTYPFQSALAMFWPGAHGGPVQFGIFKFPAGSREIIQF